VESIDDLYRIILTSLESGFNPTPAVMTKARNLSVESGALTALRTLYPWHPTFLAGGENSIEMSAIDFQYDNSDGSRKMTQNQQPQQG
jgi:hypothetical protein